MSSQVPELFLEAAHASFDPLAQRLRFRVQIMAPLHATLLSPDLLIDVYGPSGHGYSINATVTPLDADGSHRETLALSWVVKYFDPMVEVPHRTQHLSELPQLVDAIARFVEFAVEHLRQTGIGKWQAIIEFARRKPSEQVKDGTA